MSTIKLIIFTHNEHGDINRRFLGRVHSAIWDCCWIYSLMRFELFYISIITLALDKIENDKLESHTI